MKLFITGASGFVGTALVRDALRAGHRVSGLIRRPELASDLSARGAMPIRGDLRYPDAWKDHLSGVDALIHLGGLIRFAGPRQEFEEINVQPARQLAGLAAAAGIKTIIYVSAAALALHGEALNNITEDFVPERRIASTYLDSKLRAETEILRYHPDIRVVILRPPIIWGPGMNLLEEFRPTIELMGFPTIGDPQHHLATCHVQNLTSAILLALENERADGIYLVSDGERVPIEPFLHTLLRAYGMDPGRMRLPRWLALTMAKPAELIWTVFGLTGSPPISTMMAHLMGTEFTIDDTRIRQDLGYRPVISVAEGLRQLSRKENQPTEKH